MTDEQKLKIYPSLCEALEGALLLACRAPDVKGADLMRLSGILELARGRHIITTYSGTSIYTGPMYDRLRKPDHE